MKRKSIIALVISLLFFFATITPAAAAAGWSRTYSSWITYTEPVLYGDAITDSAVNGHISINASFVVSVFEYRVDPSTGYPYVDFRLGFDFESTADDPYDVNVDHMIFQIEKDSSGVGLDKQSVEVLTSDMVPYSQGEGLYPPSQRAGNDEYMDRYNLAYKVIKFGIGMMGYPVTQAISKCLSLLSIATSFFPTASDYDNAGWSSSDRWASANWFGPSVGGVPGTTRLEYYCFNTFRWWQQTNYNPYTYMGLKVRAVLQLSTFPYSACSELGDYGWYEFGPVYLKINHKSTGGGGGGGCPFLSVYDGTSFVNETKLDIHNPEGTDVIVDHTISTVPAEVNGKYLLRLTEESFHFSEIDNVKLFAMLDNGHMMKLPLISAIHSRDGNVKQALLKSDDTRTNIYGEGYNGFSTSDYIDLRFAALGSNHPRIVQFIFQIEGFNAKTPW